MSCYEWESGTVLLPSVAVKPLRDRLNTVLNAQRITVAALAKQISGPLRKLRTKNEFQVYDLIRSAATSAGIAQKALEESDDLFSVLHNTWNRQTGRFRAPLGTDVDRVIGAKGTNRTTVWIVGEASISLEGRELRWSVPENNHAVDRAHEHPLARAMVAQLDSITFTRGTGGEFVGNNEYSREDRSSGGGANYTTRHWEFKSKADRDAEARAAASRHYQYRW